MLFDIDMVTCNEVVEGRIDLLTVVGVQVLSGLEQRPTLKARWSMIL